MHASGEKACKNRHNFRNFKHLRDFTDENHSEEVLRLKESEAKTPCVVPGGLLEGLYFPNIFRNTNFLKYYKSAQAHYGLHSEVWSAIHYYYR